MFTGESEVVMDAKGRFLLPVLLRKQVPEGSRGFVISRGFEPHLNLYTAEDFEVVAQRINRYNDAKPQVRMFKRLFYSGVTPVELDSVGRLLIPKSLQEYAGLERDIILSPQGSRIEIWNTQTLMNYYKENAGKYSDLADEIAGDSYVDPFQ